jgi:HAD superfamily hydrolase (TIGR01490 family)
MSANPNQNMKKLAIIDLDGTLLKGQSQLLFLKHLYKSGTINSLYFFRLYAWFILYKLKLVDNPKKPLSIAIRFLINKTPEYSNALVIDFIKSNYFTKNVYEEAKDLINSLINEGYELILMSNAIHPLASNIGNFFGFEEIIATELETKEGKYTGKIKGDIVYGFNKVNNIKRISLEKNINLDEIHAYADHYSDIPLLDTVGFPHCVNADKKLRAYATIKQWSLIDFNK